MNSEARCILTAGDIQRALDRMGAEIVERNRGIRDLALVGIRTRGEFLAQRLQQSIAFHAVTGSGGGGKVPVGVLDTTIHRDDYDPLRGEVQIHRTEIAFDVDHHFYERRNRSTSRTIDRIENVLNTLNRIYTRDTGICHSITAIIIRTTSLIFSTRTSSSNSISESSMAAVSSSLK